MSLLANVFWAKFIYTDTLFKSQAAVKSKPNAEKQKFGFYSPTGDRLLPSTLCTGRKTTFWTNVVWAIVLLGKCLWANIPNSTPRLRYSKE
jgi:hypothetical protein